MLETTACPSESKLRSCSIGSNAKTIPVTMSAFDSAPEDEADVDREIRIERMKCELDELSGGAMISGSVGDMPPELEEIFLERACAFEKASYGTNFDRLVEREVDMIPPAELDDRKLRVKLQEVVLRACGVPLFSTRHRPFE